MNEIVKINTCLNILVGYSKQKLRVLELQENWEIN